MAMQKHALLLFSKPPIPGLVKTRLTREKGGPFSEAEAAELFKRSLFDVTELCLQAIWELEAQDTQALTSDPAATRHQYDFFISTTPTSNVAVMRDAFDAIGPWPRAFTYLVDQGANFDDHFDDAFEQIFARGYDSILSVGGDIPMLPREHVINGFRWLQHFLDTSDNGGIIQAPCQECGVSVIGWTRDTPIDHQGVYYNLTGRPALDAYVEKAGEKNVPLASMTPVADVDDVSDFAHATTLARAARYSSQFQPDLYVPERFLAWVDWKGVRVGTPPNEDRDSREGIDV